MDSCEQSPVMLCQPSWCWEDRNVPAGGVGWKTNHIFLTRQDLIPRFGQVREHHIPFTGKLLHWWGILLCFIPKCSSVYRGTTNSNNCFLKCFYWLTALSLLGWLDHKKKLKKTPFFCLLSCSPHLGLAHGPCRDSTAPCFPWLEKEKPLQMVTLPITTLLWCLSWVLKIHHDALVHRAAPLIPRICAVGILHIARTEGTKHKKLGQQKGPESGYSTSS